MKFTDILSLTATVISIGLFAAAVVGVVLYAKNKGTTSALKEGMDTYKALSEAYEKTIQEQKDRLEEMDKRVTQIEKQLDVEREALRIAVKEMADLMVCPHCGKQIGGGE